MTESCSLKRWPTVSVRPGSSVSGSKVLSVSGSQLGPVAGLATVECSRRHIWTSELDRIKNVKGVSRGKANRGRSTLQSGHTDIGRV